MIYECEKCKADLSPGLWLCPRCGEPFEEPVPADRPFVFLGSPTQPPFAPQLPFSRKPSGRARMFRAAIALAIGIGMGIGTNYARQKRHGLVGEFLTRHIVTYRVTGRDRTVDVTYQNGVGNIEQITPAGLPWSQNFTAASGTYLYLSAQIGGKSGRVKAEIDVDGKPQKTAVTEGAYATVYVNDTLP